MAELSPLRRRMIEEMTVRNLSPATQRSYLHAVAKFSRTPPARLSITHKFHADRRAQRDVSEARQSAPHDSVSRWRIVGARKITAEPGDLGQVVGERSLSAGLLIPILHEMVEQTDLRRGQCDGRRSVRVRAVEHRHPEDSPTQDTVDGDQIGQALSGPEFGLLSSTARFQDLVEHLDLPSQSIPVEFLDGVVARLDRQISDQLPVDFLSVPRCPAFLDMDHSQGKCGISFSIRSALPMPCRMITRSARSRRCST